MKSYVRGSQKLVQLFGAWPSFHDAEVIELRLWRGDVKDGGWDESNVLPELTAKVLILETTQPGAIGSGHDVLATFLFTHVDEIKVEAFNHVNLLSAFSIDEQPRCRTRNGEDLPPYLVVRFESTFGLNASFRCFGVEVIDAKKRN